MTLPETNMAPVKWAIPTGNSSSKHLFFRVSGRVMVHVLRSADQNLGVHRSVNQTRTTARRPKIYTGRYSKRTNFLMDGNGVTQTFWTISREWFGSSSNSSTNTGFKNGWLCGTMNRPVLWSTTPRCNLCQGVVDKAMSLVTFFGKIFPHQKDHSWPVKLPPLTLRKGLS